MTKNLSLRQLQPEHLIPKKRFDQKHFFLGCGYVTSRPEFGFVSQESFLRGILDRLLRLGLAVSSFTSAPTKERLGLEEELSKVFGLAFLSFSSFSSNQFSVSLFSSRSLLLGFVLLRLCFPANPTTPATPDIPVDSLFRGSASSQSLPFVFAVAFLQ